MRGHTHKTTPRVKGGRVQRKNHRDAGPHLPFGQTRVRTEVPRLGRRHYLSEDDVLAFVEILPLWNDMSAGLEEVVLADHDDDCDGWYLDGRIGICAWTDEPQIEATAWWAVAHRQLLEALRVPVRAGNGQFWNAVVVEDPHQPRPDELDEIAKSLASALDLDNVQIHEGDTGDWIAAARPSAQDDLVEFCEIVPVEDELHVYERTYACRFNAPQVRAYQLLHVFLHELGHHRDRMTRPARGSIVRGETFAEQWAHRHSRQVWSRYFRELAG